MRLIVILFTLTLLAVAVPSVAAAQDREGFWFGVGAGVGSAAIRCSDCETDRETSGTGNLRVGWTLNPRLLVGAEFNAWVKRFALEDDITADARLFNASGTVTYYPMAMSGFFVKGGAGIATADAKFDAAGTNVTVDFGSGLGVLAGAGYDIRIARKISITPVLNFWYGQLGDVKLAGQTFLTNWKQDVVDFTVGITFH